MDLVENQLNLTVKVLRTDRVWEYLSDLFRQLCDEKGYYISGGSDYHGLRKPDTFLGKGHGDLSIPTDVVEKWGKTLF